MRVGYGVPLPLSSGYRSLGTALDSARGAARLLVSKFEYAGDRNARPSRALYSAVVAVQERLLGIGTDAAIASLGDCVAELENMVALCRGALSPVRPCLEDALLVARRI